MITGEAWVVHPFFPWLMVILSWWIVCSTAVQVRNWIRLRRLEKHNKILQEMIEKFSRKESGIEEQPAPEIEETNEDSELAHAGILKENIS